ncbi:MAG: AAA family ATPase [Gemmatimonadaceae bacterium]|nr:AAA family ATPase [Gemmatimonadaceae bacterium]
MSPPHPWGDELPLVGRRGDIIVIRRLLESAINGRGTCLLLSGDAGVGKSRLLAAIRREAEARNMLVAAGSAFGMETGIPHGAVADMLGRTLRALDQSRLTVLARGAEADLQAMIPGLGPASAPPLATERGDAGSKAQLFWNMTQCLDRLATQQPLLLMLDNAHESDASSLEFLHFLARQLHGTRIMLIVACSDGGLASNPLLDRMLRSLLTAKDAAAHHLEPLSRPDLAELLQSTFALSPDDADHHAATLWSHTRGNPFFVEESLKALAAAGRIRRNGAQWVVDDTTPATLPPTVRDAVLARLDDLGREARRVAESAAILDSRGSLALLERVAGLEPAAVADAIDLLCNRRILIETRDDRDAYYEFAHPIIQATVRGELTAARSRALHAAAAQALESLHADRGDDTSNTIATNIARHLLLGNAS